MRRTGKSEASTVPKAAEPLVVVVSGGGPVGLTFSLNLAMMLGKQVKILIYESRWHVDQSGKVAWQESSRREQVVTLQDHVIDQMPKYIQEGLFKSIDERVWPTSRNIPIREVEDRLFELIQPFAQSGQVTLIPEKLHEQTDRLVKGDFDVLVGADGANSFVRNYCNIQMISEGVEYACGVAYNIPTDAPTSEGPLHQALNCILTVSQTRYLVNSSTSRRGYLNIRLIQDEYTALQKSLEEFKSRNQPINLLDENQFPQSPVWDMIRQGLKFFKIAQQYVYRVVPIEINVRHASIVVRELRFEVTDAPEGTVNPDEKKYKTALAFLAGDAAMNVHFWPGRGMNSGMKAAMALARNIHRACMSESGTQVRKSLNFLNFLDYEGFMARLRAREQQGRSLRVLINPIDPSIESSYSYANTNHCYNRYREKLIKKMQETRQRLESNRQWPHRTQPITDEDLTSASNRINASAVAQLSLANPWPTREMSGDEVLVEDTFTYKAEYIPPQSERQSITPLGRMPKEIICYRFMILWVNGHPPVDNVDALLRSIRGSPLYQSPTANPNSAYQLADVSTVEGALQWMERNKVDIQKRDVAFKVVTQWTVGNNQTAVDVIRAVRSKSARAPVLVFTKRNENVQVAEGFPNVMITDVEFDVKEFVGIKQETQWDPGCAVVPIPSAVTIPRLVDSPNAELVWIDRAQNDPPTADALRKAHPPLKITFIESFSKAESEFAQRAREMRGSKKFIIISRGYYADEKKSFTDVLKLLDDLGLDKIPIGVYTSNRQDLLKRVGGARIRAVIFDNAPELLQFVARHLSA